jgi:hypothetical protein
MNSATAGTSVHLQVTRHRRRGQRRLFNRRQQCQLGHRCSLPRYRKFETYIPRKGIARPHPNFHIHVSVSYLLIITMHLPFLLQEICGPIAHMNVKIRTEAAQFPEKE